MAPSPATDPATDPATATLAARIRACLARQEGLITYGALARTLQVPGPGSIARVTAALELTMWQDAAARRPFRAAQVVGRGGRGLPGRGFFDLAATLGRGPRPGQEHAEFHAAELAALLGAAAYDSETKPC